MDALTAAMIGLHHVEIEWTSVKQFRSLRG